MSHDEYTKLFQYMQANFKRVDERFDKVDRRFDRVEGTIADILAEIRDIKLELKMTQNTQNAHDKWIHQLAGHHSSFKLD